ncbi:MAG: restriction endonuclease [Zetaproteobacteria bacterium CG_4_10_14_0_2_um_filter_55_20]|nr:MAG: restriction endonuclease [Zetaproteobacteria bacterium CG08_land_8_20_14_0_20_55_17]PIY54309.1 MAG: restriction endonuclease [Zetaproteobacteria bacterium CG_4_10_14_0_8_um_filter_55_43]PIZ39329.1 MAG: restriction endonuclease [Zetaproteobacteria bacterium CG_4_10_14_0_2_um_filter_55_20]
MTSIRWTKKQLKLAFNLYCQLPFGKLHKGNKEIIELAGLIGRSPSALAMKLCNIASLDPAITSSGRSGLGNASALDREVWDEFHADWDRLALQCLHIHEQLRTEKVVAPIEEPFDAELEDIDDFTGETKRAVTEQRIRQNFFRRAVLSSYRGRCCMSGLADSRLLIASHIVPWSKDRENRLNPRNGLCLSALHDKAFDRGLISLDDDFRVILSKELEQQKEPFVQQFFLPLAGQAIMLPERFIPDRSFLERHRKVVFLDNV